MRKTTLRRTALLLIAALCLTLSAFASGEPAGSAVLWQDAVVAARERDAFGPEGGPASLSAVNTYIVTVGSGSAARAIDGASVRLTDTCADTAGDAVVLAGSCGAALKNAYVNAGGSALRIIGGSGGTVTAEDSLFRTAGPCFRIEDAGVTLTLERCHVFFDGTAAPDPALAAAYGADLTDPIFAGTAGAAEAEEPSSVILQLRRGPTALPGDSAAPAVVTFAGCELEGDILNTCASIAARPARALVLTLRQTTLTGAVSLGRDAWIAPGPLAGGPTEFRFAAGTALGPWTDGADGLSLTLEEAQWTVTEACWLTRLTLDDASRIDGVMTVDGAETPIEPGTYEGDIVLSPARSLISTADVSGEIYVNLDDLRDALGL